MSTLPEPTFSCLAKLEADYAATGSHAMYHVEPSNVVRAAKFYYKHGYFLEDVSGLDMAEGLEVVYHFDSYDKPGRVTVRVVVPRDNPVVPSIASVYQGAEWHEREAMDFYGVQFEGNPNPVPLLLPEDADFHPLLKEEKKRKAAGDLYTCHMLAVEEEEAEEASEGGEASEEAAETKDS